ncbi:SusD/RagB family nutrient-binding outer membrane lipoprotein [Haliscomenobacter sp.]|uniref:SusD/RagB family nutrient-binding outer membrane lipoprotein n=1 Tax=Haliscomenobacter sp. TaxID=2717303 RepID=UPI0035931236
MKNIRLVFMLLIIGLSFSACEDFLDVNSNPNAPVSENLKLSAKLSAALVSSVNQENIQLNQIGAFWAGYWGTTSEGVNLFPDLKSYNGPAIRHQRDGIPVWENGYTTLLYYQLIKEQAIAEDASFYAGIAKIMQAWHFMRLVDIYNNLPFDEALQGTVFPTPTYEEGKTVYQKSIDLISEGMADIKVAKAVGSTPTTDDVMFKGNAPLWLKFGNTLKLRALLRQSETQNTAYLNSEMQKITAEGSGFLGVNQHASIQPGYLLTAGKMNPLWENYYRNVQGVSTTNHIDIRPTQYLIDQYVSRNDPRLEQLYAAVGGQYKGVLFGNPNAETIYNRASTSAFKGPQENANKAGGIFKSATQASILLGSFESLFLQAEAAQRGWLIAPAKTLYDQAISESFLYLGVAPAAVAPYLAQENVAFNQSLEQIITQKWLALNSISSIEAWNDYRRLGIPAIPNSLDAPAPDVRPLRFMYPESERQTNNTEASRQGSDDILSAKVWWDVN